MGDMPVPGTGTATANGHAVLAEDRILPAEEEQTAEEEEEEATVHSAASTGTAPLPSRVPEARNLLQYVVCCTDGHELSR